MSPKTPLPNSRNGIIFVIPAYQPDQSLLRLVEELISVGVSPPLILVVNDGSSSECEFIFQDLQRNGVKVLQHAVNLGKGQALKSAFNEVLMNYPDAIGVVTLDADGQHAVKDALRVRDALRDKPDTLVLGTRTFGRRTPLRSRLGNSLTQHVFKFFTGKRVSDTQTGLRGIPSALLPVLLRIPSMQYDFELEMLVRCIRDKILLREVPIDTIYLNNNASSHFNPLLDSIKIYFVFIRFVSNSLLTALIDYIVFFVSIGIVGIFNATVLGRLAAGSFNFLVAKQFVFKDKGNVISQVVAYTLLVLCHMTLSYILIVRLVESYGWNIFLAKVLVESFLYIANFSIQQQFIFTGKTTELPSQTDWDKYYESKRGLFSLTRKITGRLLLSLFSKYGGKKISSIVELGGANSCFFKALANTFPGVEYTVVDKNSIGLQKFADNNHCNNKCQAINADILQWSAASFRGDVVFSVGLIEHFKSNETPLAIKSHFRIVREGGLVIMTFPSPTFLYCLTRSFLEKIGQWHFFDERPLMVEAVIKEVEKYGEVIRWGYNPWILLTQGFVVVRARQFGPSVDEIPSGVV